MRNTLDIESSCRYFLHFYGLTSLMYTAIFYVYIAGSGIPSWRMFHFIIDSQACEDLEKRVGWIRAFPEVIIVASKVAVVLIDIITNSYEHIYSIEEHRAFSP